MPHADDLKAPGWGYLLLALLGAAAGAKGPDRPNVLLILADDMGYSDAGCYGGEIRTPNLDQLAAHGLRFTQHYSTGRCWPSRACLLTGYYAQQVRRDNMTGIKRGPRPAWAPLLPVFLKPLGYRSYHSGKWHIDGDPQENGFARSWGAERAGCDWDRFFASGIWEEDGVKAPIKPGEPYYSTVAIADHAIQCLKRHRQHHGEDPFFQYVAFYAPHFPLHALQEDIASYRDTYGKGWDVIRQKRWQRMTEMGIVNTPLSRRDEDVIPSWNLKAEVLQSRIGTGEAPHAVAWRTLRDEQKKFQAAKMSIHAAMITRMDRAIGRLLTQLRDMGAYENTLILFASDNGASAEQIIRGDGHDPSAPLGSARSYLCLGPGWATAANTPFRLHKHWNHEGGISSPCIVHWPQGIAARGELRHVPSHFIDMAPTILDVAGGAWPHAHQGNTVPTHPGSSLVPAFARDRAIHHKALWWCHAGNQAIRVNNWKLSLRRGQGNWELYDLSTDRCEMNDLASTLPDKTQELAQQWEGMAQGFRRALGEQP